MARGNGGLGGWLRRRLALVAAMAFTIAVLTVLASVGGIGYASGGKGQYAPGQYQYKPGWGCGDKKHIHTGPPGQYGAQPPPGCAVAKARTAR